MSLEEVPVSASTGPDIKKEIKKLRKLTLMMYLAGCLICLPLFLGVKFPHLIGQNWLKLLHVFFVIIFFGNMTIGPLWGIIADQTKNKRVIYFSVRTICWLDLYLTIPGLFLTIFTGLLLSQAYGVYWKISWLTASVISLALSVFPAFPTLKSQYKLYYLSYLDMVGAAFRASELKKARRSAAIWGSIASIPPVAVLIFMFVKPALW